MQEEPHAGGVGSISRLNMIRGCQQAPRMLCMAHQTQGLCLRHRAQGCQPSARLAAGSERAVNGGLHRRGALLLDTPHSPALMITASTLHSRGGLEIRGLSLEPYTLYPACTGCLRRMQGAGALTLPAAGQLAEWQRLGGMAWVRGWQRPCWATCMDSMPAASRERSQHPSRQ